ncbi:MAG TPA: hypothetical protein VLE51_01550 [Candidatus Saccharimonadales bacterium]|nr:hypothetical protein [Candidatus Saccharimonadales bacterium]
MKFFRGLLSVVIPLAILGVLLLGLRNFQAVNDWLKLRNYSPPSIIAKLATEDQMTEKAKHIFYVNHPQLVSNTAAFRTDCTVTEQTIVLGCYHGNQDGIFIYNVQDARLNGVLEVTAAHEMLHGAYDRLNSKDRNSVDQMLNDYYAHDLHDQRILDTIKSYQKTEPNDVVNEMHSVFGTEAGSLPPKLENYYQRYFANRSAVVTFANSYEDEFTSRIAKINVYEQQLNLLKQKIDAEKTGLAAQVSQIEADRRRLESLRSSGQISQYNSSVASFNTEVDAYNKGVSELKSDITQYNNLVVVHNQLATELRSLYSSLDTSLSPQTAQ